MDVVGSSFPRGSSVQYRCGDGAAAEAAGGWIGLVLVRCFVWDEVSCVHCLGVERVRRNGAVCPCFRGGEMCQWYIRRENAVVVLRCVRCLGVKTSD